MSGTPLRAAQAPDHDGGVDPGEVLCVHPSVAVRPEPFGALAYHYGNRKLVFLKARSMVRLVETLDGVRTVEEALAAAGIPESHRVRHREALASLVRSDMLHPIQARPLEGTAS